MSLIDKAYFTLEELEERWQLPHRDLVYLAENGLLRLSVRLFGVEIEFGIYEEGADGEWFSVAQDRRRFTGFQDLQERDVFRLFRQGQFDVVQFHAPENEYCHLIPPTRRSLSAARICWFAAKSAIGSKSKHDLVQKGSAAPPSVQQANDYREVRTAGLLFNLGPVQARVVKRLHEAATSSIPGARASSSLAKPDPPARAWPTSSSHSRIGDDLINSDGRGRYRLRVPQR